MRQCDDKEAFKAAIKEAAKEWLNDQFASFGRWTAIGVASGAFYLLVKIFVTSGYWPK